METIDIAKATEKEVLYLGRVGEKNVTSFTFDFSAWRDLYGSGEISAVAKRYGEEGPYPVQLEIVGDIATWAVSDIDTGIEGVGEAEFIYTLTDGNKKSVIFKTYVDAIVGAAQDPPDPYDSWYQRILEAAQAAGESALIAEQAAESAEQSAEHAAEIFLFTDENSDGNVVMSYAAE